MQKIVPQLFDTNASHNQTMAMMFLLKNVDSSMAKSIGAILVENYTELKLKNDTVRSNSLLNAAESYGGKFADTLKRIDRKYKTADSLEKLGYTALADKKVNAAMKYFGEADSAYPTFRQSYEIKTYLIKNKAELKDSGSDKWKDALKTIAIDFDMGIPGNLKKQFLKEKQGL